MNDLNGVQLAPCVVSKARHALEIPNRHRNNVKLFTRSYWERTIDAVASHYSEGVSEEQIQRAKDAYISYLNLGT